MTSQMLVLLALFSLASARIQMTMDYDDGESGKFLGAGEVNNVIFPRPSDNLRQFIMNKQDFLKKMSNGNLDENPVDVSGETDGWYYGSGGK